MDKIMLFPWILPLKTFLSPSQLTVSFPISTEAQTPTLSLSEPPGFYNSLSLSNKNIINPLIRVELLHPF